MNIRLTIIIPCYNCHDTLKEAVDSCFVQGLDNFEIVMVDDGSTDDTKIIIQKLAEKYPEIRLFYHDTNKGGGAARNTAVEQSRADVIFCLDGDDVLPRNTLSKMLAYMNEKKCDGVTIHRSIKFTGDNIHNIHHIDTSPYLNKKIPFTSLLSKNKEFCPVYVNFMYTKNAFNKASGYPTSHGYDTQGFAWRFLSTGLSVYTCPDAEYLHRIRFNESYFMREYNNGKMNYNWRDILLEHYYVFNEKTLAFIYSFECGDFTRNIIEELTNMDDIFILNYENTFGKIHRSLQFTLPKPIYIKRNSVKGYYLRIKSRFKGAFKKKIKL